jgi:hypothetical protein
MCCKSSDISSWKSLLEIYFSFSVENKLKGVENGVMDSNIVMIAVEEVLPVK